MTRHFPRLRTLQEIADLVGDDVANIQGFVRDDRIPYMVAADGVLVPIGGFQACLGDLYGLAEELEALE